MTVAASPRRAGPYPGNGAAVTFPFEFKVFAKSDVAVLLTDVGGSTIEATLDSDYSVSLNPDQDANPGGSIAYPLSGAPLASGEKLTVLGGLAFEQPTDLTNVGRYQPQVVEDMSDRSVVMIQQLAEEVSRSLRASPGSELNLVFPSASAGRFIRWRADLLGLENADAGTDSMALQGMLLDPEGGGGMVGFDEEEAYPPSTVGAALKAQVSALLELYGSGGASHIGFIQAGAGAIYRTLQAKARETISATDFAGILGDGATNCSAGFVAQVKSGRRLVLPAGTYKLGSACYFENLSNLSIEGAGNGQTVIVCDAAATFTNSAFAFFNCTNISVSGITFRQANNPSFTALRAALIFLSCKDLRFYDNEILQFTYIGLAVDSCERGWIENNRIERDATMSTTNHCINVASSVSVSTDIWVMNNRGRNSGSIYRGKRITIGYNKFSRNGYGGGVVTSGDATDTYGYYTVIGNYCEFGAGIDSDGVHCAGYEIGGPHNLIVNNTASANGGKGFALLGWRNTHVGNLAIGNGTDMGGPEHQAGFALGYVGPLDGCYQSLFVGNRAYDLGAGVQLWGYREESALLVGNNVKGNDFTGSAGNFLVLGGGTYEFDQWVQYTPIPSTTSGSGTVFGTCTGFFRYRGRRIEYLIKIPITTNGTGSGRVRATLPVGPVAHDYGFGTGRANIVSGKQLLVVCSTGTANIEFQNYDNTYPGATGETLQASGWYAI